MRGILVAVIVMAVAGPASAQNLVFTPVTDGASMEDEPNVNDADTFNWRPPHSPAGYPEDSNGIPDALLGGAPARVLEMRPQAADGNGGSHQTLWLLTPLLGQDYALRGVNEFRAVYGDWTD